MSKENQCSDNENADIAAKTRNITGVKRPVAKIKGHKDGQGSASKEGGK